VPQPITRREGEGARATWTSRRASADGVGLDVLIEELAGVVLGAIGRQQEKPNLLGVLLQPCLHGFREVNGVAVDDEKDLLGSRAQQTPHEVDEHLRVEAPLEDMKAQRAAGVREEMTLQRKRLPVPGTTGVCPRLPQLRPT
jgi:hypothetical protein